MMARRPKPEYVSNGYPAYAYGTDGQFAFDGDSSSGTGMPQVGSYAAFDAAYALHGASTSPFDMAPSEPWRSVSFPTTQYPAAQNPAAISYLPEQSLLVSTAYPPPTSIPAPTNAWSDPAAFDYGNVPHPDYSYPFVPPTSGDLTPDATPGTSYGTRAEAWAYSTYTSPSGYQPENAFMTSHPGSSCDPLSPASADADYASLRGLSLREEHPDTASHSSAPLPGCKPRGRRGRRRAADQSMRPAYRQHMLPSEDNKRFPCTLGCNSCFRTKADWKRHEATHVPAAWICMPEGKESAIRAGRCIFCGERNPTTAHFKAHNLKACLMRPVQDRGFARKDNLKQHIQQVHLKGSGEGFALGDFASEQSGLLDEWNREPDASTVDQAAMWCGFCNHSDFASWRERMDHVGLHFVQPYDVRDWEMASDSERM